MAAADLHLPTQRRSAFPGHQPLYRRELELPVENTSFCCGHCSPLRELFLIFVSHFWGALQKQQAKNNETPAITMAEQ
jgi:hypothetical protein